MNIECADWTDLKEQNQVEPTHSGPGSELEVGAARSRPTLITVNHMHLKGRTDPVKARLSLSWRM